MKSRRNVRSISFVYAAVLLPTGHVSANNYIRILCSVSQSGTFVQSF